MMKRRAARKCLGYALHEKEVLGACQNISARLASLIHVGLDIGKKVRSALNLVEHHSSVKTSQEGSRILHCLRPVIRTLQGDIGVLGKHVSDQGGLARLPGANHGDHRHLFGSRPKSLGENPLEHEPRLVHQSKAVNTKIGF